MAPSSPIAIIAGVGPGTGAAMARKFALTYPVVLMARNPDNYNSLVDEINGNKTGPASAMGISTDVSDAESVKSAFGKIEEKFGKEAKVAAAVFNVGGRFIRKPFATLTLEEFESGWEANGRGAFLFAHSLLPFLLSCTTTLVHPPTLIFTGATASLKGSAQCSSFATGKHALRALAQSLAREYGPQGVHVAHAIIDGVIDIPRTREWKVEGVDGKLSAEAVSEMFSFTLT
ncbi:MAG: hypothetical protein LQ347_002900 [Umbilicaria vellea]|nr:MAG: hypothetical protein LQ347_002900 [Umbilicaria vellea]